MPNTNFTVEEINLIAIYESDTLATTLEWIDAALEYMDEDTITIAENATRKLSALTEPEFTTMQFTPTDDEGSDHAETIQESAG